MYMYIKKKKLYSILAQIELKNIYINVFTYISVISYTNIHKNIHMYV